MKQPKRRRVPVACERMCLTRTFGVSGEEEAKLREWMGRVCAAMHPPMLKWEERLWSPMALTGAKGGGLYTQHLPRLVRVVLLPASDVEVEVEVEDYDADEGRSRLWDGAMHLRGTDGDFFAEDDGAAQTHHHHHHRGFFVGEVHLQLSSHPCPWTPSSTATRTQPLFGRRSSSGTTITPSTTVTVSVRLQFTTAAAPPLASSVPTTATPATATPAATPALGYGQGARTWMRGLVQDFAEVFQLGGAAGSRAHI